MCSTGVKLYQASAPLKIRVVFVMLPVPNNLKIKLGLTNASNRFGGWTFNEQSKLQILKLRYFLFFELLCT